MPKYFNITSDNATLINHCELFKTYVTDPSSGSVAVGIVQVTLVVVPLISAKYCFLPGPPQEENEGGLFGGISFSPWNI